LPVQFWSATNCINWPADYFPQGLCLTDSAAHFDPQRNFAQQTIKPDHPTSQDKQPQAKVFHDLIQSLNVLGNLHALGYVHGDLKREHFRQRAGRCYLIDFEQAVPITSSSTVYTATPRYMAPELFQGRAKSIQSDIYALGIIWYEWLSGQRVQQTSYLDWATWHCQRFQPDLSLHAPKLDLVLKRMLCKNKTNRYADIFEIKQALSHLI